MAKVTVEGIPKLKRRLRQAQAQIEAGEEEGRRDTADFIADEWRGSVPVLTGAYMRSIDSDEDGAFATADHAPFVEFGTSVREAQPAGSEAATRGERRMPALMARRIRQELR